MMLPLEDAAVALSTMFIVETRRQTVKWLLIASCAVGLSDGAQDRLRK